MCFGNESDKQTHTAAAAQHAAVLSRVKMNCCVSGFGDKPVHRDQTVGCAINLKEAETMKLSIKTKQEISAELHTSRGTARENPTGGINTSPF